MPEVLRFGRVAIAVSLLAVATVDCIAQTPAQLEYERQQREYWRQQEQQRQDQQRQQQIMQDNARRQQDESSRINSATGGAGYGGGGSASKSRSADPNNAAAWTAARAEWEKRPPLAPDNNPLLGGRWARPANNTSKSSDPFAGLMAMAKGGMCEVLFGGGVFEFRRDALVGMDSHTPAQELDKVEYRGSGKHIVVLPKTTIKLIEFDFETPDRIRWTSQNNCVLVRVKSDSPSKTSSSSKHTP